MPQRPIITFDEKSKEDILHMFGISIDREGYLIRKNDPDERILTEQGEPIALKEFAGVRRGADGSLIFVRNDLPSLIKMADILQG